MKKQLTKQELKDKEEKKQRILKFVKRSINIVCYCLSVLFLILCFAVGVQSCNSSKDKTNKLIKRDNNYSLRDNSNAYTTYYYFDEDKVRGAWQSWQTSVDNFAFGAPHEEDGSYSASCRAWGRMNDINGSHEFRAILYRYDVLYEDWTTQPVMRLTYIYLQNFNTGWSKVVYDSANNIFDNSAFTLDGNFGNIENLSNSSISESETGSFSYFWLGSVVLDTTQSVSFTFNDNINFNGPYNSNTDNPYFGYATSSDGLFNHRYYDFDFVCYGQWFNRIDYVYSKTVNGEYFKFADGEIHQSSGGELFYYAMYYVNTYSGANILVNMRNQVAYYLSNGGLAHYWDLSSSWISQYYRNIKLLNEDEDLLVDLSKFNSNVGSNTGVGYGNIGLSSVFDLLSNSFLAIFPLISIEIIPGLTIGLLLFLPLVVTIIILVFKAVKK